MSTAAIVIEIRSTAQEVRDGKDGKQYAKQQAAMHVGGDWPLPIRVPSEAGKPYPAGRYTIDPSSFRAGKYGDLELGWLKLLPLGGIETGAARAAAK